MALRHRVILYRSYQFCISVFSFYLLYVLKAFTLPYLGWALSELTVMTDERTYVRTNESDKSEFVLRSNLTFQ